MIGALAVLASACTGAIPGIDGAAESGGSSGTSNDAPSSDAGNGVGGMGGSPALGESGAPQVGAIACDAAAAASVSPLRRLSELQYRSTLRDLFGARFDVLSVAADELSRMPVDDAAFRIMDGRLSNQHVRAYYLVANRVATSVTSNDATLKAIAGQCALDATPAAACVEGFLDDFVARAYRRPLSTEERSVYRELNDGSRDSRELFRSVLFMVLQAPALVYHSELEGEAIDGNDNYYRLDAYELASRLSYHFWQSMPDDLLFAAARDGSLLTEEGYAQQVSRMFDDPRAHEAINAFYREWWHVGWLNSFPDTPAFRTLAQGTTLFDAGADHLQAMTDEITALTEHFTFATSGTLRDLLLTDLSFTKSPHLAALYGVEPWDGAGPFPHLPAGERAGILTRGAFLVNDNHTTHPIHRGVVVRRRLLCDELEQPDPASLPAGALTPPPITADLTTRERFEAKTSPATCNACHRSFNPIGFVLERYDALGRYRSEERILDETTGEVLATLPIDSTATPKITPGDARSISSAVDLSEMIADGGKVEGCFARQYFRFTYGRTETNEDGCATEAVRKALATKGSLAAALKAIALEASFRSRRVL